MRKPILDIKNASVYRGTTQVFDNFSLSLNEGENTAILGPNGAGKTTLLKLITREISPVVKSGSYIKLFGNSKTVIWEHRQKIGIVSSDFQNDYQSLATGLDVVLSGFFGSVGIHQHHIVSEAQREAASGILKKLSISHLSDKRYLLLSTGQQRRLLLARALIHHPRVLIFDEPTNGLDLKISFELIRDIRALLQKDTTLILVTHHIQEIIPEISRVIFLKNGGILNDGEKSKILTEQQLSTLYETPLSIVEKNGFYQALPQQS